ncbi:MAG: hypothetical protein ACE144_03435 [Thermodesulfobacteriota bacterium]
MSLKYLVFTVMLTLIVILLGVENYATWTQPLEISPGRRMEKKTETRPETIPVIADARASSIASYVSIAEKNIFNPERKEFPLPMAATQKPPARPQVILYGVTILADRQYASVATPGRPLKKGERETITLKPGEKIGEYKLTEILPDRIRLEASGDSFEVLLYDPATPKRRSDTKTATKKPPGIPTPGPGPMLPSAEAPKPVPLPVPSPVPAERPRVPSQETVSPPPSPPPVTQTPAPTFPQTTPPPVYPGRTRRVPYPPPRTPLQQGGS